MRYDDLLARIEYRLLDDLCGEERLRDESAADIRDLTALVREGREIINHCAMFDVKSWEDEADVYLTKTEDV